jgi:hypothetical protein
MGGNGTFCDILYITFITEASAGESATILATPHVPRKSGTWSTKAVHAGLHFTGKTHCVNFQVGVPGSLSTIFSF